MLRIIAAFAFAALVIIGGFEHYRLGELETRVRLLSAQQQKAPPAVRQSRGTWPTLGMDKTIALAEALKGAKIKKIAVFCPEPECDALAHDIDDAMQLIDISSDLDRTRIGQSQQPGITIIAYTTEEAAPLVKAFAAVGIPATAETEERAAGDIIIAIGRKHR